jgi:hypothetical protein
VLQHPDACGLLMTHNTCRAAVFQNTLHPLMQDDADLDPLSAMEKYCRSELPQQRLAYAAVSR